MRSKITNAIASKPWPVTSRYLLSSFALDLPSSFAVGLSSPSSFPECQRVPQGYVLVDELQFVDEVHSKGTRDKGGAGNGELAVVKDQGENRDADTNDEIDHCEFVLICVFAYLRICVLAYLRICVFFWVLCVFCVLSRWCLAVRKVL